MSYTFLGYDNDDTQQEDKKGGYTFLGYDEPHPVKEGVNKAARLAMQGSIGAGQGAIYRSPAGIPAMLLDLLRQGATEESMQDILENDREQQGIFKSLGTPDAPPPIDEAAMRKGAKDMDEKLFNGEGVVGSLVSAPYKIAGIDTKPQDSYESAVRNIGNWTGLLKGGASFKRAIGAGLSAESVREIGNEIGLPEPLSEFLSMGAAGATAILKPGGRVPIKGSTNKAPLEKVAEREGLPNLRGITSEKAPSGRVKPYAFPQRINRINDQIEKSVQDAVQRIIEDKIPLAELERTGQNLDTYKDNLFKVAKEEAKKSSATVDVQPVIEGMEKLVSEIEAIPSPSNETLSIKKDLERKLRDFNTKRFFTGADIISQYQELNSELSRFYKKVNLGLVDSRESDALRKINRSLFEQTEKQLGPLNPEFVETYKKANNAYSQIANLRKIQEILTPLTEKELTTSKLQTALRNPKKLGVLEKRLGKESVQRLKEIGQYLDRSQDIFKLYGLPPQDFKELLGRVLPFMKTAGYKQAAYLPLYLMFGPKAIPIVTVGEFLARYAYGRALLSPKIQRDWLSALKAVKNGSREEFEKMLVKLSEDFREDQSSSS